MSKHKRGVNRAGEEILENGVHTVFRVLIVRLF